MACSFSSSPPMNGNDRSKILCRYYVHGSCRYGDLCRFSHNLNDKPNLVCTYHRKGHCAYGKECRYDHIRDRNESKNSEPSTSVGHMRNLDISYTPHDENWADAVEFVPGRTYFPRVVSTYSSIVRTPENLAESLQDSSSASQRSEELCPFHILGNCQYGDACTYLHGSMCDMCGVNLLHPNDVSKQEEHKAECLKSHEEDMKVSFNVAQSAKVSCGICMEVVWEKKEKQDRKFGILENCNHAFCLECIRKWRSAKSFQNTVVRACPECRVPSSFVTPSENWITEEEEKKKLIQGYKEHLSKKACKHFDQGRGQCPFGANCFYLHAYPDGTKQDRSKIPKRVKNANGDWRNVDASTLWDFIEDRDGNLLDLDEDFFDLVYLLGASFGDDDDSDLDRWEWLAESQYSDDEDSFLGF